MPDPIACDLYDYIEIACLYHYDVRLQLCDGSLICGKACTTVILADKVEAIQLSQDNALVAVPLHTLAHMQVTTPNAKFQRINFIPQV